MYTIGFRVGGLGFMLATIATYLVYTGPGLSLTEVSGSLSVILKPDSCCWVFLSSLKELRVVKMGHMV